LSIWHSALLSTITCAANIQMAHVRPFWTSTLQDLSNGIKNISMRGVLTPKITLWILGNPRGFPSPIFRSVSGDLTLPSKWGCDILNSNKNYNFEIGKCYQMEIDSSKVLGNLSSKNYWEEIWKDKGFFLG